MADSPWEMWSALGTVAAVVVALGISAHAALATRKTDKDRSELAAARMLSPLSALERKASYLSTCIAFRESCTGELDPIILLCLDDLDELSKNISIEDLYPLLRLPKHAAKRASRSLGLIQTFLSEARAILTHEFWGGLEERQKTLHYTRWMGMLSDITDLLIVAVQACEAAASIGAPRPTPGEIHGGPLDG